MNHPRKVRLIVIGDSAAIGRRCHRLIEINSTVGAIPNAPLAEEWKSDITGKTV
jgi:hypothetical protein